MRAKNRAGRRARGSALTIAVIAILLMFAFAAALATVSVSTSNRNLAVESRLQARTTAVSGLDRAIAELDGSVAIGGIARACSHTTVPASSCFGNIDGNTANCRVWSATTPPSPVVSCATRTDTFSLDTGAAVPDGWKDFKGQATDPRVALSHNDANGSYTVRSRSEGAAVNGRYEVYRLRSYGVWGREVVGLEALARREIQYPFARFAVFGINWIVANGSVASDSWTSGYPPAPGVPYVGPPAPYNPASTPDHGDLGSSGSIRITGGSSTIQGQITPYSDWTPPVVTLPPEPTTSLLFGPANVRSSASIGSAASPVYGDAVVTDLSLNGSEMLNLYPASGQTIRVWIRSSMSISGGSAGIRIFQPATGLPGTVKFLIEPSATSISIGGQGVLNTDPTSSPACCEFVSATTSTFDYHGGTDFRGVILASASEIDLGGGITYYGSVLGQTIKVNGNVAIHYDESAGRIDVEELAPHYRVCSLVEIPVYAR